MFDWLFGKKKKTPEQPKEQPLPKQANEKEAQEHKFEMYQKDAVTRVEPKRVYQPRDEDEYEEKEFDTDSYRFKKEK